MRYNDKDWIISYYGMENTKLSYENLFHKLV